MESCFHCNCLGHGEYNHHRHQLPTAMTPPPSSMPRPTQDNCFPTRWPRLRRLLVLLIVPRCPSFSLEGFARQLDWDPPSNSVSSTLSRRTRCLRPATTSTSNFRRWTSSAMERRLLLVRSESEKER